jgi:hypothetical protein
MKVNIILPNYFFSNFTKRKNEGICLRGLPILNDIDFKDILVYLQYSYFKGWSGGIAQLVKHLPASKSEALSSNSNTDKLIY